MDHGGQLDLAEVRRISAKRPSLEADLGGDLDECLERVRRVVEKKTFTHERVIDLSPQPARHGGECGRRASVGEAGLQSHEGCPQSRRPGRTGSRASLLSLAKNTKKTRPVAVRL